MEFRTNNCCSTYNGYVRRSVVQQLQRITVQRLLVRVGEYLRKGRGYNGTGREH